MVNSRIEIRQMCVEDIEVMSQTFTRHDIQKSIDYFSRCWDENLSGERITLLAFYEGNFAGSLHLHALMDAVEEIALEKYGIVGLGVGLYDSYGSAQRMYARRGYVPDGRGVMYK